VIKPQNEPKMILSFGLFVGLVCLALAAYLSYKSGQPRFVLGAVGAYFLAGGVLYQPMLRPVFLVWMKIAFALGWFNTRLLLSLVYFLLFTPIGLVQRLFGRDALGMRRPTAPSLWTPKAQAPGKNSYYRQF
jgi:hypothetical protein